MSPSSAYFPAERWRTATPESQGIDSVKLVELFQQVRRKGSPIHSLLIVRHGYAVLDAHFFPYDGVEPHDLASVTKSVTASIIGVALDQGKLRGLDQPMLAVFDDRTVDGRDGKAQVTVADLLAMRSGLACENGHDEVALAHMRASDDWIQTMLDSPMAAPANTRFTYCSGGMHLLSGMLSHVTGVTALTYARQQLFAPLGIDARSWPSDPAGNNFGWGDLHLAPLALAKLGYLYLQHGRWNGRQILSPEWIAQATRARSHVGANEDYALGWWLHPEVAGGLVEASGRGGQRILIFPQQDMVMAITGGGLELDDIAQPLLQSISSKPSLPENPTAQSDLAQAVQSAASAPPAGRPMPAARLPKQARRMSGNTYRIGPNAMGLTMLTMQFPNARRAMLKADYIDGSHAEIPLGLDGVALMGHAGRSGLATLAKGRWEADHLVLDLDEIANINAWHLEITLDDEQLQATGRERSREDSFVLSGQRVRNPK